MDKLLKKLNLFGTVCFKKIVILYFYAISMHFKRYTLPTFIPIIYAVVDAVVFHSTVVYNLINILIIQRRAIVIILDLKFDKLAKLYINNLIIWTLYI